MSDVFYIAVTGIFAIFTVLTLWWLYRYMNRKSILETRREDLSDDQKALLYKFCDESRRKRIAHEAKKPESKKLLPQTNVNESESQSQVH